MTFFQKNHSNLCSSRSDFSSILTPDFKNKVLQEIENEQTYYKDINYDKVDFLSYGKFFPGNQAT